MHKDIFELPVNIGKLQKKNKKTFCYQPDKSLKKCHIIKGSLTVLVSMPVLVDKIQEQSQIKKNHPGYYRNILGDDLPT